MSNMSSGNEHRSTATLVVKGLGLDDDSRQLADTQCMQLRLHVSLETVLRNIGTETRAQECEARVLLCQLRCRAFVISRFTVQDEEYEICAHSPTNG